MEDFQVHHGLYLIVRIRILGCKILLSYLLVIIARLWKEPGVPISKCDNSTNPVPVVLDVDVRAAIREVDVPCAVATALRYCPIPRITLKRLSTGSTKCFLKDGLKYSHYIELADKRHVFTICQGNVGTDTFQPISGSDEVIFFMATFTILIGVIVCNLKRPLSRSVTPNLMCPRTSPMCATLSIVS